MAESESPQIEALFREALARAAGDRAAFLTEACQGDVLLRRKVERLLAEREEAAEAERRAAQEAKEAPRFEVLAATFRDESAATNSLRELIDAGYDGSLISADMNGTVLHEVRLGPYPGIEAAREVAGTIREAFGLAPTVVVETERE